MARLVCGLCWILLLGYSAVPPIAAAGYYVAWYGSDSNPGTLMAPFATLARAQSAMRGSRIKIAYIRGGTYYPSAVSLGPGYTAALHLIATDSGETWAFYPPDGVASAVIDG